MRRPHCPTSSYRFQFNRQFRFCDAERLLPYLETLGVSDCYASPVLKAVSGSEHGYDVCDYGALNPELGSDDDFDRLAAALAHRDLGLILDFVPNHMGLDPAANRWWRDVLEYGRRSPFAEYFDIDWWPVTEELRGRVLLPILEDGYGDTLHRGAIQLALDGADIVVRYHDRSLPTTPASRTGILREALRRLNGEGVSREADVVALARLADDHAGLRVAEPSASDYYARAKDLDARMQLLLGAAPAVQLAVGAAVDAVAGVSGDPASFDRLHEVLEQQHYRLAHWKTSFDEINYRRFFDVNQLGAIRMEVPRVFEDAHRKILQLIGEGKVTGLRIDHPDGLLDPAQYFSQLRDAIAAVRTDVGEARRDNQLFHVVAEKVLGRDEMLPQDWKVWGTTGYGFLNDVNGLFVDGSCEPALRSLYARVTGRHEPFSEVAHRCRRLVTRSSMASELAVLTHELKQIAGADRRTRDFTTTALRRAIAETVASMPVYRSYVIERGVSARDIQTIDIAIDRARRHNPVMAPAVFLLLRQILLDEGDAASAVTRTHRRFAMRMQQFSAPVQAKGIEDTAFYRYNTLISLNEVGGDPGQVGSGADRLHAGNRERLERWPAEMTSTATHDTKRGEDSRARLNVLSEMVRPWRRAVMQWRRINALRRTAVDREPAPDANDEYLFYQAILGAWPLEAPGTSVPVEAPEDFVERVKAYMLKAVREAKTHTSWLNQNRAYEDAVSVFVETTLRGPAARRFLSAFVPFVREVAQGGVINSLSQLVLKIASPGVPDFYQGTELWQFDFADPDNRRPVDYGARALMLEEMRPWLERCERLNRESADAVQPPMDYVRELVESAHDGRIKLFVTAAGLRLRRRYPLLFLEGAYESLRSGGPGAQHIVAFARRAHGACAVAVAPRLLTSLKRSVPATDQLDPWKDTWIQLPPDVADRPLRSALTGASVVAPGGRLPASDVFACCPVNLLLDAPGLDAAARLGGGRDATSA